MKKEEECSEEDLKQRIINTVLPAGGRVSMMNRSEISRWIKTYYTRLRWTVIPCHLWNKHGKKTPFWGAHRGWKEPVDLPEALHRLTSARYRQNGMALVCGSVSGVFVLDVDRKDGVDGHRTLEKYGIPIDPATVSQETQSGGRQYVYSFTGVNLCKSTRASILEAHSGVDLRAEGGLAFIPPSEYEGRSYRWLVSPFDHPLTAPPARLLDLLRRDEADRASLASSRSAGSLRIENLSAKQLSVAQKFYERARTAKPGTRSGADFALVVWLCKCRVSKTAVWEYVKNVGKFAVDGLPYFETTYSNALLSK